MKTKYEQSWDRYSEEWSKLKLAGKDLGVEWGTEELTVKIFEKYLRPHLQADCNVLEIGPGGGKYSVLVAPECGKLICADVSVKMLKRVEKRLADRGNLETLKLGGIDLRGVDDESLDLAFSIDVFVHLDLEDLYGYIREMHRALRPGGTLVLHFANFLSDAGWDLFHREADLNRAQFKQMGRINFITCEMVQRLLSQTRFEDVEIDTEISPRDFIVRARKPVLPTEGGELDRHRSILERTGEGEVVFDFIHRVPYAVIAAAQPDYVAVTEFELGGDRRPILFEHPPTRIGYALTVPARCTLRGAIAVHPDAHLRCAEKGVTFEVLAQQGPKVHALYSAILDPRNKEKDGGWREFAIPMTHLAGEVVFLVFETKIDSGQNEYNWCGWAEPALVRP